MSSNASELIGLDQAKPPFFVGVDVGGTNIKVGLVDDEGQTLSHLSIRTLVDRGAEDGAERIGQAVKEVIAAAGLRPTDIARVGLGTPGTMDVPTGMLLEPVNLKSWRHFPIRDRVAFHVGLPVTYANDAKSAAYGEFWVGSGRNLHSMVLFTLGTGIGGGIVIGDLLVVGEHSHGAECGHMIIDYNENARMCGCGHTGHLEAYASATAVIKRTEEALAAGHKSSLTARIEAGAELTPLFIGTEAEAGDQLSLEIVLNTARYIGIGAVNMMHIIDPCGIVLGGAMTFGGHATPLGRQFLATVKEEIQRRALPIPAAKTTIDFATLGGDAGYIGVAGLARQEYRRLKPNGGK
jgi:glucokinase